MNREEMQAHINRAHAPETAAGAMVYMVWEDGEVTLQKGGDLLWQRILHSIIPPHPDTKPWPIDLFPGQKYGHGFVIARDHEEAAQLARLIGNPFA